MKILILYSTKSGTTAECAELLAKELHSDVTICELAKFSGNLENFDLIVFGSYIRMGKIDKKMYAYLSKNHCKNYALFICAGLDDKVDDYFEKCFPKGFADSAILKASFGGELKLDRQKGFDKILTKILFEANTDNDEFVKPTIFREEIGRFADKLREMSF